VKLAVRRPQSLTGKPDWLEGQPLWKVVPKRDTDGKPYTDFMMLAPGLNKRRADEVEAVLALTRGVLERFDQWVVFADFNLSLNVLWVSLRYQPGLMAQMVAVLRAKVPMLRLVAHNPEVRG
jgi:hypothetical protein